MGQREHPAEDDEWRLEAVRVARPGVQAVGDSVELFLAVDAQVRALGQVLAQQAVRVLAGAALPRAVRITEVHRHARSSRQILVACQLLALVVRQDPAARRVIATDMTGRVQRLQGMYRYVNSYRRVNFG